jgi:hypothetical protein
MHAVLVVALVGMLVPSVGMAKKRNSVKKHHGKWHWCFKERKKHRRHYVVCVDGVSPQATVKLPGAAILKPNTPIAVTVRHKRQHPVHIEVSGQGGLHVPGTRLQQGSKRPAVATARGGSGAPEVEDASALKKCLHGPGKYCGSSVDGVPGTLYQCKDGEYTSVEECSLGCHISDPGREDFCRIQSKFGVTTRLFAPRVPKSEVTVSVSVGDEEESFAKTAVQLIVEETFSGALRMGIAGIFGNAVDRTYRPYMHAGSGQHEIVANESGPFDLEFVIGFAPFLERGGRGYTSGSRYHFAPYVGVGVLSMGGEGHAQWLKSIHLGLEWEPTPTFSIAFTGVLRRVTRLRTGSVLGGPTGSADDDVPTAMRHELGMAVVLNLSPDFFQFGTSGVAGVMSPGGGF